MKEIRTERATSDDEGRTSVVHRLGHMLAGLIAGIPSEIIASAEGVCPCYSSEDPIYDILICLMGSAAEGAVLDEMNPELQSCDRSRASEILRTQGMPIETNLSCLEERARVVALHLKGNLERLSRRIGAGGLDPEELPSLREELRSTLINPDIKSHHEAGHAVAAMAYGFDLQEVALEFTLRGDGKASWESSFDLDLLGKKPTFSLMSMAIREMTACYAGPIAEERHTGLEYTHDLCSRDVLDAAEIALALEEAWKLRGLYDRLHPRVLKRARVLIERDWDRVIRVAAELRGRLHLTGDEAQEIAGM